MINYVTTKACRSKTIGNYFNDLDMKACGICDNCVNQKAVVVSKIEFENMTAAINELIAAAPVQSNVLLKTLSSFKKNKVWKVLDYLQSENRISISGEGLVSRSGTP